MSNEFIELPTQEYLLECFDYNPEIGILTWKERPRWHFPSNQTYSSFTSRCANKTISTHNTGYISLKLNSIRLIAHRIIWKLYHGEDPKNLLIDHINGIRDDNRICNLRLVTYSENNRNVTKIPKTNTSGYVGVGYVKETGAWRVYIFRKYLGSYNTKEEAVIAREIEMKKIYGEDYYNTNGGSRVKEIFDTFDLSKNPDVRLCSNNTSGYVGIGYNKRYNIYTANIRLEKKNVYIGSYHTKEEAVEARKKYLEAYNATKLL